MWGTGGRQRTELLGRGAKLGGSPRTFPSPSLSFHICTVGSCLQSWRDSRESPGGNCCFVAPLPQQRVPTAYMQVPRVAGRSPPTPGARRHVGARVPGRILHTISSPVAPCDQVSGSRSAAGGEAASGQAGAERLLAEAPRVSWREADGLGGSRRCTGLG